MCVKLNVLLTIGLGVLILSPITKINAQEKADTVKSEFKPSGKVWGYLFGDYAFKPHADSLKRGTTSYSTLPKDYNSFNIRRLYFGYDYTISEKFSTTIVIAHESGVESNTVTDPSLTSDSKRAMYIKFANLTWKNIIPRGNLVIGQQGTPTCTTLSEKIWGYRSVEKTITDMRSPLTGSSTTDLGVGLFGKFDKNENFGYEALMGNGNGAKLENNNFKKIYTSIYAWLWDKKVVVQANYDYDRTSIVTNDHTSKTLMKIFVAYQTAPITIGVEAFMQTLQNNSIYTMPAQAKKDTSNATSFGISIFMRGTIIKNKLGFFARYDNWNADTKFNGTYTYTTGGLPNVENFITAGLDYTPHKNIHVIPNIWFDEFSNRTKGITGLAKSDYDMVVRVTLYYIFR